MASSDQTETKAETTLPKSLLDSFKTKDTCPRCKADFLQTAYSSHEMRQRRFVGIPYGNEAKAEESDPSSENRGEPYDVPYGSDNRPLIEIMNHLCVKCGYAFSETEEQQKRRKEKEKDKNSPSMSIGFLLLLAMLASIWVIEQDSRNDEPPQNSQQEVTINENDGQF